MKTNKMVIHMPESIYVQVGEMNPRPVEVLANRIVDGEALFATNRGSLRTKDKFVAGPIKVRRGDVWMVRVKSGSLLPEIKAALGIQETTQSEAGFATADDPVHIAEAWVANLGQDHRPEKARSAERAVQVDIPMRYHPASGYVAGAVQFTTPLTLGEFDTAIVRGVIYPTSFGAPKDAVGTVKAVAEAAKARRAAAQAQPTDNVDEDAVTC